MQIHSASVPGVRAALELGVPSCTVSETLNQKRNPSVVPGTCAELELRISSDTEAVPGPPLSAP